MKERLFLAAVLASFATMSQGDSPNQAFMREVNSSMQKMNRGMDAAPMNGDVDHDFAEMMIPHHAGALDMAKAELRSGKDPVMRRMAQEILVEQQSEIDAMNLWLQKQR